METFEKVNRYIKEFDSITKVRVEELKLIVTFECLDGGSDESIELNLIFNNPIVFKLPYYRHNGTYEIENLDINNQKIIEKNLIDGYEKLYLIRDVENDIEYYVLFETMDIFITGCNYHIINETELLLD